MDVSAKAKAKSSTEGWGMGFLLVFFPEDDPILNKKKKNLFSSSPSLKPSSTRTHASNILSRAQSTISICALILFITLLLFTLSTFEPTTIAASSSSSSSHSIVPRRWLSHKSSAKQLSAVPMTSRPAPNSLFSTTWFRKEWRSNPQKSSSFALQGMGCLYRRGTRAMNDLVVGHVTEDVTQDQFRMFLRALYRSSTSARADVVLIFSSSSSSSELGPVVQEETEYFSRLVRRYGELNSTSEVSGLASFDASHFLKFGKKEKERKEPLWGRRIRSNYSDPSSEEREAELSRLRYGSVVGFEAAELDPENSLAGFLDHVPMSLRRWACYHMILGRVRRNFKHMMLVDVKSLVLLGDPLGRVRSQSTETVFLWTKPETQAPKGRKSSDRTQNHQKLVNSEIIMGGSRGVRRLSKAMLIEIVRATMQRKGKSPLSESVLLNQLVSNGVLSKGVDLTISDDSVADSNALAGVNSNSTSSSSLLKYSVVQRGNSNHDLNQILMKDICSSTLDSSVYSDC